MTTILEALQNAEANIDNIKRIGLVAANIAKLQLHNAITLLDKGFELDADIEQILEESEVDKIEDVANAEDFYSC